MDNKRKRKSLSTCDEAIAYIAANQHTGFTVSPTTRFSNGNNPALESGVSFMETVNQFIKSKWGIDDTLMHKPNPNVIILQPYLCIF